MKDTNVTINDQTYHASYEVKDQVITVYFEYGKDRKSEAIGSADEAALAKVLLAEMVMEMLKN
ncbi:hypothetical protein [Dactylococcopsis salina]|uniref:Uncharacterized protein n=1 Tax=Dactylococcopsis salina (strain PCC 8305) TaxID=13035 RepID=K9YXY7_DACS8|nr:hypothetical protein [Dactylococcopsis salina]AFZ51170.1 hypothetical protein Dacsa_2583 [Dactylococcopsis salina PCC 8305]